MFKLISKASEIPIDARSALASDNWSGLCPEALDALVSANAGSAPPYGEDAWSKAASDQLRDVFDFDAEIFYVSSGTAGNSLVLAHLLKPYETVLCHEVAHIRLDECGAPAFFGSGIGIRAIADRRDGRIDPEDLRTALDEKADLKFQPPGALSLTQTTERGTLYTQPLTHELIHISKDRGLPCHMDGARFFMACEALQMAPADLSWKAGVDVLVLGSSKLGGGVGDAILFFNRPLAKGFAHRLKQSGQVSSKMRLMTGPWLGLLEDSHYRIYARHALIMAVYLEQLLASAGFTPWITREANAIFIELPDRVSKSLRDKGWVFHGLTGGNVVRLMTGWDTQSETLEAFVRDIQSI